MGRVTKRIENGKMVGWQYRYRDPSGKQCKITRARKTDAEREMARIEAELHQGTYVDPEKGKQTFEAFAESWRVAGDHSPNYAAGVEATLRLHVYPVFGSKAMSAITDADIRELIKSLAAKGFVATTIQNYTTLVRTVFKAAVRKKIIPSSPCEDVKVPKGKSQKVSPLDSYAVASLIAHMEHRYRAMIVLAAATGGRQGELFGLQVDDVTWDREAPAVHFRRQLQVERGRGIVVRPPKDYEDRLVRIDADILDVLADHVDRFPHSPDGFIFTRPGGGLMHARMFNARPWSRAREKAAAEWELAANAYGEGQKARAAECLKRSRKLATAGMHDLRDYFASLLITAGQSVATVSDLLGHANQSTTLNHYSHLWEDTRDQARNIVGEHLRSIGAVVPTVCPTEIN